MKVRFEDPKNGFIGLKITYERKELYVLGSYCPRNSLVDLAGTLKGLLEIPMESVVIWNEEPTEYEMRFSRTQQQISLTIDCYPDSRRSIHHYDRVFTMQGSYETVCIPFWRALRDLQGRFSAEELTKRWHSDFPFDQLNQLTAAIDFWKSANPFEPIISHRTNVAADS